MLCLGHRDRLWVVVVLQVLRLTQEVSDIHLGALQAGLLLKVHVMSTPLRAWVKVHAETPHTYTQLCPFDPLLVP